MTNRIRKMLNAAVLSAVAFAVASLLFEARTASAGDWIFRRSYFTHTVPPHLRRHYPLPQSRSAYRQAYVGDSPGFSVQWGYRINRIIMRSGSSTDVTIIRENWLRVR